MRKPRPFSHTPIYVSERRDRLAEVEQRARRELGLDPPEPFKPDDIRGMFAAAQRHRKGTGWLWNIPMLLLLIAVLAAVALIIV